MNVREKLVELLTDNLPRCGNLPRWDNPLQLSCDEQVQRIADHLVANGVTVQEWISVKDRLPDLIPCNAGTAYSEAVIAWTSGRKVMIAVWDGIDWIAPFDYWEAWGEEITHWMPLPHPPKGE